MKKLLQFSFALLIQVLFIASSSFAQKDAWTETFDDQTSNSYGTSYTCAISGTWTCQDAGNFSYANSNMGSPAFTINDDKPGAQITTPELNTCGTVSFKYAYKNGSDANVFVLQKSTDGTTFTDLDTHTLGASANMTYVDYSFVVNDNSSSLYIRVLSDDQNAHLFIEDFTVTDYSSGGNTPPSISNIVQTPDAVTSSSTVSVSADVTDSDGTVAGVELHWGTTSGSLGTTISMSNTSGDTYTTDREEISGTDDDFLYRSDRSGGGYNFDVPPGTYRVQLRFAEIFPYVIQGRRVFDVLLEDQVVLDHLDIYAAAGNYRYRAVDFEFNVRVTDGQLNQTYNHWTAGTTGYYGKLSAIRVTYIGP